MVLIGGVFYVAVEITSLRGFKLSGKWRGMVGFEEYFMFF